MDDEITPSVLKLNDRLRVRMSDEFAAFRAKLRKMPIDDVLDNAYKYVICCDILTEVEVGCLSQEKVRALLRSPHPLQDVFDVWSNAETDYMENVLNAIENTADSIINAEKLNKRMNEACQRSEER